LTADRLTRREDSCGKDPLVIKCDIDGIGRSETVTVGELSALAGVGDATTKLLDATTRLTNRTGQMPPRIMPPAMSPR
jgi:hypothetical protein